METGRPILENLLSFMVSFSTREKSERSRILRTSLSFVEKEKF